MSIIRANIKVDGHIKLDLDSDGDGFVDASSNYQLIRNGSAIDLTSRRGRTYSDDSSTNWNAVKAITSDSGFQILLAGANRFDGKFGIWNVNSSGVISSFSGWKSTAQALENGWESLFGDLIQSDGTIGSPSNDGSAIFQIIGIPEINQTLKADLIIDDPDGNGTFNYAWQTSDDLENWRIVGEEQTLSVTDFLLGKSLRVAIAYTDGEGFSESITTDYLSISEPENGDDYSGDINTTGILNVNSSTTGEITDAKDRDWFLIVLKNKNNYQFDLIGNTLTDPQLNLRDQFGSLITGNDDAGSTLDSRITFTPEFDGNYFLDTGSYENLHIGTYTLSATKLETPTNDGTATFIISGSPVVNETLTVELTESDPDGNGSFIYSWQSSSNQTNWTEVGSESSYTPSNQLSGLWLRASIQYTDGEGFKEVASTEPVRVKTSQIGDDYSADTDTTGTVTIGSSNSGNLEEAGDHDWYAIELEADTSYLFNVEGNTLEDTYLYLRGGSGDLLKSDDDSGEGLNSRIRFRSSKTGRYYLDVGSYDNNQTGTYNIFAEQIEDIAPSPISGFNSIDGYGQIDASRAFEQLLGVDLPEASTQGGNLWGLDNINAPDVWSSSNEFSGTKGAGSVVAVIDTGVDLSHPEFKDRIIAGYDFVDNDPNADDEEGHGTHVAGTIGGSHDDGIGISGVAPESQIMPIRVLDSNGDGWTSDIIAGIRWATDNGADVINLSLGGGGYSQALADAIRYASDRDSVVVMAAGNSGGLSPEYPAAHAVNYGIAVGAVNQSGDFANFSNRAGSVTMDYVTAPGVRVYSATPGGSYERASGTSMAAPHVAGVAALLKSHNDSLTPESIEDLIIGTARNANRNTSQILKEPVTNTNQIITHENLDQVKLSKNNSRLIGKLDGNMAMRKSTINDLKKASKTDETLGKIDVISSTRKNFVSIDFTKTTASTTSQFLQDWLSSDQFDYFEVDAQMSII